MTRPPRQALGRAGSSVTLALPGVPSGWWTLSAELAPDELRADDQRIGVVRVAPVARVAWDSASRLRGGGVRGARRQSADRPRGRGDVRPAGAGQLGGAAARRPGRAGRAQPRARRARRGLELRRPRARAGDHRQRRGRGRVRVARRYLLQSSGSGRTGVLATVAGEPWIVRSGDVVLLGSRLEPEWTELPLSAGFMPFMDLLLNRLARGEVIARPGRAGRSGAAARPRHRRAAGRARVAGGGRRLLPSGGRGRLLPRRRTRHARRDQRQPRPAGVAAGPRAATISVRRALERRARDVARVRRGRCWSSPRARWRTSAARCSRPRCSSASAR